MEEKHFQKGVKIAAALRIVYIKYKERRKSTNNMSLAGTVLVKGVHSMAKKESFTFPYHYSMHNEAGL